MARLLWPGQLISPFFRPAPGESQRIRERWMIQEMRLSDPKAKAIAPDPARFTLATPSSAWCREKADAAGERLVVAGSDVPASSGRARPPRPPSVAATIIPPGPIRNRIGGPASYRATIPRPAGTDGGRPAPGCRGGGEGGDFQGLARRRESSSRAVSCGAGRASRSRVAEGAHRPLRSELVESSAEAMERDFASATELALGLAALAIAADDVGPVGSHVGCPGHQVVSQ